MSRSERLDHTQCSMRTIDSTRALVAKHQLSAHIWSCTVVIHDQPKRLRQSRTGSNGPEGHKPEPVPASAEAPANCAPAPMAGESREPWTIRRCVIKGFGDGWPRIKRNSFQGTTRAGVGTLGGLPPVGCSGTGSSALSSGLTFQAAVDKASSRRRLPTVFIQSFLG